MVGIALAAVLSFSVAGGATKERIPLAAEDGTTLSAVVYRNGGVPHRPTVVLAAHGPAQGESGYTDELALELFVRGFDVVVWDRRGTGKSGGLWDYGRSDAGDLRDVLREAVERTDPPRVGVIGLGSGAVAAIRAVRDVPEVGVVVVHGVGLTGLTPIGRGWLAGMSNPDSMVGRWVLAFRGIRADAAAFPRVVPKVDLREAMRGWGRRRTLVSAGGHDDLVRVEEVRALFDAAPAPKEWLMADSIGGEPDVHRWGMPVEDFLRTHLR